LKPDPATRSGRTLFIASVACLVGAVGAAELVDAMPEASRVAMTAMSRIGEAESKRAGDITLRECT
jgi:hypothetical protein